MFRYFVRVLPHPNCSIIFKEDIMLHYIYHQIKSTPTPATTTMTATTIITTTYYNILQLDRQGQ